MQNVLYLWFFKYVAQKSKTAELKEVIITQVSYKIAVFYHSSWLQFG